MIHHACKALTSDPLLQHFLDLYAGIDACLTHTRLQPWRQQLPEQITQGLSLNRWGDLSSWLHHWADLPPLSNVSTELNCDSVTLKTSSPVRDPTVAVLTRALQGLHPWRKGPFDFFGLGIDTEWRSNLKWDRVAPHLDLTGKIILDVGCGNGYYGWRMLGAGARGVIGIDPSPRFVLQWGAVKRYSQGLPCYVLPLGIEQVPEQLGAFDLTFSMGVLYHRKSPFDHLQQLKDTLRPGGQLVLETLVIEGEEGMTLLPGERYAKMRNVWLLPSVKTLLNWLKRCGYTNSEVLDISHTTTTEQRRTAWMRFESLADFLDPADSNKTIEGYPAPKRAVILTTRPNS